MNALRSVYATANHFPGKGKKMLSGFISAPFGTIGG
jgi:hypothetical protein